MTDVALELAFDPSVFIALDQKRISISGRVDQPSFVVTTGKVTDDQPSFLRISSDPGITRKDASEVSLALLNDFRGPDWTIPVEVHTDRKAKRWRLIKRSIAEGLVAVFTVAAASILSRFISGDPSKPIEPWVIPAIIFSLSLVVVGIGWRIKLDETKTK